MVGKISSSKRIAIENALEDIDLRFDTESLDKIVCFFDRHFRSRVSPDVMLNILRGLATINNLDDTEYPNKQDLLDFLYDENKIFTIGDLFIISEVLKSINEKNTVPQNTMEMLYNNTNSSYWISALIIILEQIFYREKSHKDMFGIISADNSKIKTEGNYAKSGFEYYEMQGHRVNQEDALVWKEIKSNKLSAHSSEEIGHRLWTAYQDLDEEFQNTGQDAGTTASTTVCTKDSLITATLSDTIAFAVITNKDGSTDVHMLCDKIRNPSDKDEQRRIKEANGFVVHNRVEGVLATPRSIGDGSITGRCPDADINIFDLTKYSHAETIEVITVCDGFTEPLIYPRKKHNKHTPTKEDYEQYLKARLKLVRGKNMSTSQALANDAYQNGSQDNISISVQTIRDNGSGFKFTGMLGIYDGHAGYEASHFVAKNIIGKMQEQLKLSEEEYSKQTNSVQNLSIAYSRDNKTIEPQINSSQENPRP
ncbi:MAG: hypothetical protein P1U74_07085 [Legionellaceae bacterium]|nr:hypothetical protein [Legionellaceae bacterium]